MPIIQRLIFSLSYFFGVFSYIIIHFVCGSCVQSNLRRHVYMHADVDEDGCGGSAM